MANFWTPLWRISRNILKHTFRDHAGSSMIAISAAACSTSTSFFVARHLLNSSWRSLEAVTAPQLGSASSWRAIWAFWCVDVCIWKAVFRQIYLLFVILRLSPHWSIRMGHQINATPIAAQTACQLDARPGRRSFGWFHPWISRQNWTISLGLRATFYGRGEPPCAGSMGSNPSSCISTSKIF